MSVKRLSKKVEMKQEPVTVTDTRKVDLSFRVVQNRYFAAQYLKDLHTMQR